MNKHIAIINTFACKWIIKLNVKNMKKCVKPINNANSPFKNRSQTGKFPEKEPVPNGELKHPTFHGVLVYALFNSSLNLSAIIAINSEFVGFPLAAETVYPKIFSIASTSPRPHATSIA